MPHHPSEPGRVRTPLGLIRLGDNDLAGITRRVAEVAREELAGATDVSITVLGGQGPYTAASTSELALELDELQYAGQQGPCLQAAAEQVTVLVGDTAADPRWGRWPQRAAAAGAAGIMSLPLPMLDDVDGALNVYSRTPGALGPAAVRAAEAFAEHAAATLANAHLYDSTARLARQMQTAMERRAVIEQAKGIIMRERRCTPDEAFTLLTTISQKSNRKVRDIAAALVARTQTPPAEAHSFG